MVFHKNKGENVLWMNEKENPDGLLHALLSFPLPTKSKLYANLRVSLLSFYLIISICQISLFRCCWIKNVYSWVGI